MKEFRNRCFGAVVLKSINSNWNADFTHHPRTLPDGTVYATDKALKYAIKDYIRKNYPDKKVLYMKTLNKELAPMTLEEAYESIFGEIPKKDDASERFQVLGNLMDCLDIRLFGATFAAKGKNLSIHGPVQINHAIDKMAADTPGKNEIYSEQIMSPFRNPSEKKSTSQQTTLGNQTNLKEGHYVYHFSVNPLNTADYYQKLKEADESREYFLSDEDIDILKEAMNVSVTRLDSSRKIGTENEATIFITLKEDSRKVLPGFTDLITIEKNGDMNVLNCAKLGEVLGRAANDIEIAEMYYNPVTTKVTGLDGVDIDMKNLIDFEPISV
ncbi:MAG: type I CRISPR-associated protein Cas7 [Bacteroidota bacterium]